MNKLLIIDTATSGSTISLSVRAGHLITKPLEPFQQTKQIIPIIEELLNASDLSIHELDGIAVCVGPGMFTGIRVGVMTAKTLSYGANIPLYPFSTFDLFKDKEPAAIIDAKVGRCYILQNGISTLIKTADLPANLSPIYCLNPADFKTDLPNLKSTTKDLPRLRASLKSADKCSHENIDIFYPN